MPNVIIPTKLAADKIEIFNTEKLIPTANASILVAMLILKDCKN